MSVDIGVVGVWGFTLTPDNIGAHLHHRLQQLGAAEDEKEKYDFDDWERFTDKQIARVRAALLKRDIEMPENFGIRMYNQSDDDQTPARSYIKVGTIFVGYSVHSKPWLWPELTPKFKELSDLYTWEWFG